MGCRKRTYDCSGKTVLITGGNSGIGRASAEQLGAGGAHVIITARDAGRGREAAEEIRGRAGAGTVEVMALDYARLTSVRSFADALLERHARLDVLVHNAGGMQAARSFTEDGCETAFQVNVLAPFLLTDRLLPLLRASAPARVVIVGSSSHKHARLDLDDLQCSTGSYIGLQVYARAKLAGMMFGFELARRLEGTGVTVNLLHPGTVRTGFGLDGDSGPLLRLGLAISRPFFRSPQQAARNVTYLAAAPELEGRSGSYYARCRPTRASAPARDADGARHLWEQLQRLTAAQPGG